MAGQLRWPVTVSWGELRLRPPARGDRREWDVVRHRVNNGMPSYV